MGQLMALLGEKLPADGKVGQALFTIPGDVSPRGQSVPLRLAGALHRLVLCGVAPELAGVYPPACVDDATLWNAVARALDAHADQIIEWCGNAPRPTKLPAPA